MYRHKRLFHFFYNSIFHVVYLTKHSGRTPQTLMFLFDPLSTCYEVFLSSFLFSRTLHARTTARTAKNTTKPSPTSLGTSTRILIRIIQSQRRGNERLLLVGRVSLTGCTSSDCQNAKGQQQRESPTNQNQRPNFAGV
jgi:hypothetical protein